MLIGYPTRLQDIVNQLWPKEIGEGYCTHDLSNGQITHSLVVRLEENETADCGIRTVRIFLRTKWGEGRDYTVKLLVYHGWPPRSGDAVSSYTLLNYVELYRRFYSYKTGITGLFMALDQLFTTYTSEQRENHRLWLMRFLALWTPEARINAEG